MPEVDKTLDPGDELRSSRRLEGPGWIATQYEGENKWNTPVIATYGALEYDLLLEIHKQIDDWAW